MFVNPIESPRLSLGCCESENGAMYYDSVAIHFILAIAVIRKQVFPKP
jgi:hypothetical protein